MWSFHVNSDNSHEMSLLKKKIKILPAAVMIGALWINMSISWKIILCMELVPIYLIVLSNV